MDFREVTFHALGGIKARKTRIHQVAQDVYFVTRYLCNTRGGSSEMVLKRFAQILGVVLILVGLVGLVLGDRVWLGILNVDIVEDIVHLATGGLLAYVGFSAMDLSTARSVVLDLGSSTWWSA